MAHLPSHRRLLLIALVCCTVSLMGRAEGRQSPTVLEDNLAEIHNSYLELDQTRYRLAVLRLTGIFAPADTPDMNGVLERVLAFGRKGADGLEPMIILATDAVFAYGAEDEQARTRNLLQKYGKLLKYRVQRPNSAFMVPLTRVSTSIVMDIRADAARLMGNNLIRIAGDSRAGLLLDDLLGRPETLKDLCNLPARTSNHDRGVATDQRQANADAARKQACEKGGSPGGGKGGKAAGALGNIAESACMKGADFRADTYTMEEQADDMRACIDSLRPDRDRGPGGGLTMTPAEKLAAWRASLAAAGETQAGAAIGGGLLYVGILVTVPYVAERWTTYNEVMDALDAYREASKELSDAIQAEITAEKNLDAAEQELSAAEDERDAAQKAYDNDQSDENKRKLDDAKAKADQKKKERDDAKKEADQKEKERQEKQKKTEEASKELAKKQKDAEDPVEGVEYSPECERAMFGRFRGTEFYRDVGTLLDRLDKSKGPPDIVSNWAPDSDFGIHGFGLNQCGFDNATLRPHGVVDCGSLTQCPPDDPHCACGSTGLAPSAELAQSLAEQMCGQEITCEVGTPRMGVGGCGCYTEEETEDPDFGGLGPDVEGPSDRFIDALFAEPKTARQLPELTSVERFTIGAVRNDVSPENAFSHGWGWKWNR